MKIKIPIYHYNDHTYSLEEMGLEVPYKDCDIIEHIFYQIDGICVHKVHGKVVGTCIYSGGADFLSPSSLLEIKSLIDIELELEKLLR